MKREGMMQTDPASRGKAACAALAALSLAACAGGASLPQVRDTGFVRGCWVEKDPDDGRISAFLRLLPEGPESSAYAGHLQFVRGVKPGPSIRIAIARDGMRAWANLDGASLDMTSDQAARPLGADGSPVLSFAGAGGGSPDTLVVRGAPNDRLTLTLTTGERRLAFAGERDGCD